MKIATSRFLSPFLVAVLFGGVETPASASIVTSVAAEVNSNHGVEANNAGDPFPPEKAVHGVAAAVRDSSNAFVSPGGAGPCEFVPAAGCAFTGPAARAMGEVRGDLGRLKARALANVDYDMGVGEGFSEVSVELTDALTTTISGDVAVHLHVDVDVLEAGDESTIVEDVFELRLNLNALGVLALPEFVFTTPTHQGSHTVIDQTFRFEALPAGTNILLQLSMLARTECSVNQTIEGGLQCAIVIDAGNTAYLGIEGAVTSQSGFSYPGFVGTPTTTTSTTTTTTTISTTTTTTTLPGTDCASRTGIEGLDCMCAVGTPSACAGLPLPAAITTGFPKACTAADAAASASGKKRRRALGNTAKRFARLERTAGKPKVSRKLSSACVSELQALFADLGARVDMLRSAR